MEFYSGTEIVTNEDYFLLYSSPREVARALANFSGLHRDEKRFGSIASEYVRYKVEDTDIVLTQQLGSDRLLRVQMVDIKNKDLASKILKQLKGENSPEVWRKVDL